MFFYVNKKMYYLSFLGKKGKLVLPCMGVYYYSTSKVSNFSFANFLSD